MLDIYDKTGSIRITMLENAYDIQETLKINQIDELQFSMPYNDPKTQYCELFAFVQPQQIYSSEYELPVMYRIISTTTNTATDGTKSVVYHCEHAITTLIDAVHFQSVRLEGRSTMDVISYILNQQSHRFWQLGWCDFNYMFGYGWSNENLLAMLHSVPNQFLEDYQWVYDFRGPPPWRVDLYRYNKSRFPEFWVHDGQNLLQATSDVKSGTLANRIFALGYGEGVNQLKLNAAQGGPYFLEDTASIAKYGLVERILEDGKIQTEEELRSYTQHMLNLLKEPEATYSLTVADLYKNGQYTPGSGWQKPMPWHTVRWNDVTTYIVSVTRWRDRVGQDTIELSHKPIDVASTIANLADRQRISRVYAQGNTVPFSTTFADNASTQYPLTIQCYIPAEAKIINKVIIAWQLEAFRSYEASTAAGGAKLEVSSLSDAISTTTSNAGGGADWTELITARSDMTSSVTAYTDTPHAHGYTQNSHRHQMYWNAHYHQVNVPRHTHDVNLPDHTHPLTYGMYTGATAQRIGIEIDNDGVVHPIPAEVFEQDITEWLAKDAEGKILRGRFHTIKLIPAGTDASNPQNLTRLSGTLYTQMFIQSEGGGVY